MFHKGIPLCKSIKPNLIAKEINNTTTYAARDLMIIIADNNETEYSIQYQIGGDSSILPDSVSQQIGLIGKRVKVQLQDKLAMIVEYQPK